MDGWGARAWRVREGEGPPPHLPRPKETAASAAPPPPRAPPSQAAYDARTAGISSRNSELQRIAEQLAGMKGAVEGHSANIADATPVVRAACLCASILAWLSKACPALAPLLPPALVPRPARPAATIPAHSWPGARPLPAPGPAALPARPPRTRGTHCSTLGTLCSTLGTHCSTRGPAPHPRTRRCASKGPSGSWRLSSQRRKCASGSSRTPSSR